MKDKAERTKEAALAVASSIIDRNDPDGTKSAAALAKLGSVSDGLCGNRHPVGAGRRGPQEQHQQQHEFRECMRLEGDILAARGNAGYDPLESDAPRIGW